MALITAQITVSLDDAKNIELITQCYNVLSYQENNSQDEVLSATADHNCVELDNLEYLARRIRTALGEPQLC